MSEGRGFISARLKFPAYIELVRERIAEAWPDKDVLRDPVGFEIFRRFGHAILLREEPA